VATLCDAWEQFCHFVEHHHINEEVRSVAQWAAACPSLLVHSN
jgi:hypothetical protein